MYIQTERQAVTRHRHRHRHRLDIDIDANADTATDLGTETDSCIQTRHARNDRQTGSKANRQSDRHAPSKQVRNAGMQKTERQKI
jgi:hypothetical protein